MAVILVGILIIKCLIFIKVRAGGHKQGWVPPPLDFQPVCIYVPKSLGESRLSGKIAWGGSPFFGIYCVFINKCFEICLRGYYIYPPPPPPLPPVCIYDWVAQLVFYKLIGTTFFIAHYRIKEKINRAFTTTG